MHGLHRNYCKNTIVFSHLKRRATYYRVLHEILTKFSVIIVPHTSGTYLLMRKATADKFPFFSIFGRKDAPFCIPIVEALPGGAPMSLV